MFAKVKKLINEAMDNLKFLIQDGLGLSQEWIPDSVEKAKELRKKAIKCSFELMKVKKILFGGKKGKISFELEGEQNMIHTLSVKLLS